MKRTIANMLKVQKELLEKMSYSKVVKYQAYLNLYHMKDEEENWEESEKVLKAISEEFQDDQDFYIYALFLDMTVKYEEDMFFRTMSDKLKNNKDFAKRIYYIGYKLFRGVDYCDEHPNVKGTIYSDIIANFNDSVTMDKDVCEYVATHDNFGFGYATMQHGNRDDKFARYNEQVLQDDDLLADAIIRYDNYVQENEPIEVMPYNSSNERLDRIAQLVYAKTEGKNLKLVKEILNLRTNEHVRTKM